MKGKKEGVLKRKREREERKQLKIINSNKPEKLKMKKKPVVRKINKKTPTGGTVRKRPAMVMDDSSSEDLTEVESELEDTEEKGSEEAFEEPVNNKTQMYEKINYIPLVKGSYYLRQLEPNKKLLAVGKLIDTVTDTTVTFQHFQSEPFTNKLIFRPWMDEETVTTESFVSHLNLPDMLDPGRKIVFQEGDLSGSNLK